MANAPLTIQTDLSKGTKYQGLSTSTVQNKATQKLKVGFCSTPSLQKQMQSTKFTMREISNKGDEGGNVLPQKQIHQMCACLDLDAKKLSLLFCC